MSHHDVRSLWILADICFHARVHIAWHCECPTHEYNMGPLREFRRPTHGGSNIRHGAGGDDHQVITVLSNTIDEEVHRRLFLTASSSVRHSHIPDTVGSVDEFRDGQHFETILSQGMRFPRKHRNVRPAEKLQQGKIITHPVLHEYIPVSGGDPNELQLGGSQCISQGQGIINTHV